MRDILELVLVLSIICLVAALSLAKVYDITKEPIALQKRLARLQTINAVLPPHDNEPDKNTVQVSLDAQGNEGGKVAARTADGSRTKTGAVLVYRGLKGDHVSGVAFEMKSLGFGGEVGVMIGLDPNGIIRGIEITSMNETPGLGARVAEPAFKQQFQGKSLNVTHFKVKKDGGDFDQVTGATITPRAVVQAVKNGLEFYQKHKESIIQ
ncbi:MAG: RnfABCDGE type electron transport complex subunit G [bacterium]